jgi:hypothetical protein
VVDQLNIGKRRRSFLWRHAEEAVERYIVQWRMCSQSNEEVQRADARAEALNNQSKEEGQGHGACEVWHDHQHTPARNR